MIHTRILDEKDKELVPRYLEILYSGLDRIKNLYSGTEIADAVKLYTPEYVYNHLTKNAERRFTAGFYMGKLEGVLIESFDKPQPDVNRTNISWVVSNLEGRGLATRLIHDCLYGAIGEGKDQISLVVAEKNNSARILYQNKGFGYEEDAGNGLIAMHHVINRAKLLGETDERRSM
jgi:GNAT superfamily N-acetyltransferase